MFIILALVFDILYKFSVHIIVKFERTKWTSFLFCFRVYSTHHSPLTTLANCIKERDLDNGDPEPQCYILYSLKEAGSEKCV